MGAGGDGTGDAHNVYVAPDGARFVPWCGLLVNVTTLEIQVVVLGECVVVCVVVHVCGGACAWWCVCMMVRVRGGACAWWCVCVVVRVRVRECKHTFPALPHPPHTKKNKRKPHNNPHNNKTPPPKTKNLTKNHQADYTRYSGERLISTMTLPHTRAELNLVPKLCQFLQPKCHPLLLDTSINSADVVGLNIYQVCEGLWGCCSMMGCGVGGGIPGGVWLCGVHGMVFVQHTCAHEECL